jgi:hypothetical protein
VARYTASFSGIAGVNTANTQLINLAGGTTERLLIREVYIACTTAPTTGPLFALGRSTAAGTTSSTATTLATDPGAASGIGVLGLTWSAAPTFTNTAANRARVKAMTAAVGQEAYWPFYDVPFMIAATSGAGLVVWNVNASGATLGAFAGHVTWDED